MRYVDLSHEIEDGMITYKGLPAPLICDFLSRSDSRLQYEGETSFQIGQVEMVGNTGTYIDCPFHRFADGKDFSTLFISDLADLVSLRIDAPYQEGLAIGRSHFEGLNLENKAILIHTGWSTHWRTDRYFEDHPFLTAEAAELIKEGGAKVVGIDSHNIDDTNQKNRPVHTTLLGANICIVEHMCQLHLIPPKGGFFTAVPPKLRGMGSFPVRAFVKF
ncbi:MAG: cyclase family protein [Saprospiraceae bacterium]|nr:cyclase family protein [Saprospiraceae bacterium]